MNVFNHLSLFKFTQISEANDVSNGYTNDFFGRNSERSSLLNGLISGDLLIRLRNIRESGEH